MGGEEKENEEVAEIAKWRTTKCSYSMTECIDDVSFDPKILFACLCLLIHTPRCLFQSVADRRENDNKKVRILRTRTSWFLVCLERGIRGRPDEDHIRSLHRGNITDRPLNNQASLSTLFV